MSRTFTTAQLVARVRSDAGMLGDDNPSNVEICEMLSAEYTRLYGVLCAKKRGYFMTTVTLVTSGISTLPLPADFIGLLRLDWSPGSNQPLMPLVEADIREIHQFTPLGPSAVGFLIVGPGSGGASPGVIELFPTPPTAQSYVLRYTPAAKKLTLSLTPAADETNVVEGFSGWEELMVLGVVKRLRSAEESDTTDVREDIKDEIARVHEEADNRNASQAQGIAVVEGYDGGYGSYGWRRRLPPP